MIKLNFVHLCEYAFVLDKGTAGIIGIFSKVKSKSRPANFSITVILNIDPNDTEKHIVSFVVKAPSGSQIIKPLEKEIGPAVNKNQSLGIIANIQNIKLREEGKYKVEIIIDKKKIETLSFDFEVLKK